MSQENPTKQPKQPKEPQYGKDGKGGGGCKDDFNDLNDFTFQQFRDLELGGGHEEKKRRDEGHKEDPTKLEQKRQDYCMIAQYNFPGDSESTQEFRRRWIERQIRYPDKYECDDLNCSKEWVVLNSQGEARCIGCANTIKWKAKYPAPHKDTFAPDSELFAEKCWDPPPLPVFHPGSVSSVSSVSSGTNPFMMTEAERAQHQMKLDLTGGGQEIIDFNNLPSFDPPQMTQPSQPFQLSQPHSVLWNYMVTTITLKYSDFSLIELTLDLGFKTMKIVDVRLSKIGYLNPEFQHSIQAYFQSFLDRDIPVMARIRKSGLVGVDLYDAELFQIKDSKDSKGEKILISLNDCLIRQKWACPKIV
jgi:hypothetical protein